ncbi:replication factor C small subunit [Halobellus sp. GM3]|uniref:replication factor C small subunit n=1 Tax=Halobellus sp. GM3 TaxID=3458410 RepID=UPI00403D5748
MSEGEASADVPAGREIWIEKYRPETFDDIYGQEEIVGRLRSYVERGDLPHLLFAGPAGVGKCVTGETPVLTNNGIERIDSVVGDVEGFGEPESDLHILSITDANEFEYVKPSHVFGKQAAELRRIETRDGNTLEVTPEHKLLVLTEDGLTWKEASDVIDGDRIARPRQIPTCSYQVETVSELNWLTSVDDERIQVRITTEFAAEFGFSDTTISPTELRSLELGTDALESGVRSIQYVNASGNRSRPITPPWRLTPELARFVGLAVAEARIDGGRIKFYNTDEDLCDAFEKTVQSVFGLEPERGTQKGVPYVVVRSKTLTHFLSASFDVFASASDGSGIGSTLVVADDESRAAFVRAMFDGEAYVSDHGIIELTQKNGDHITLLSYLLSTFGIPSRRGTVTKSATNGTGIEREYHELKISGSPAIRRFAGVIGFSIDRKQRIIKKHADKKSNPNHDTIPRQRAARQLCETLNLPVQSLISDTRNPDNPGRSAHQAELTEIVEAAAQRIESAQEALVRVEQLSAELDLATGTPAKWMNVRRALEPIETRRELSASTGVRSDRLLEYADGRRTPYASRVTDLIPVLDGTDGKSAAANERESLDLERLQRELSACIDSLDVSYERVAENTDIRGVDVNELLTRDDHALGSLVRFETVAERVQTLATEMLSLDVIERIDSLSRVVDSDLYYDEVIGTETVQESRRVYDLTVPSSRNYVAGSVPTVMHNTTAATTIAREVYGDDWRNNFLELNASDERGIDVVRDRIKNFARSSFGGYDHRIIFLDEADSLTDDAQSALRRTMEQFSDNTRFILSCNYSSKIIDPIQSRCAVFRFSPLSDDAIRSQVVDIAEAEGIEVTEDGLDALVYAAGGDMRRAINSLQAAATTGDVVDEETVYLITSTARPEEIEEMVRAAIDGDFASARSRLETLLVDTGMAGGDIIDQLHRSAWDFDLDERTTIRLMERIGEADYRITAGANERVQLEALLASLAAEE